MLCGARRRGNGEVRVGFTQGCVHMHLASRWEPWLWSSLTIAVKLHARHEEVRGASIAAMMLQQFALAAWARIH